MLYKHYSNMLLLLKLINIYFKISFKGIICITLLSVLLAALPNIVLITTEKIGNSLTNLTSENISKIVWLLVLQSSIYIVIVIFSMINKVIQNNLNAKYGFFFSDSINDKLTKIKPELLDNSDTYNKIEMISRTAPEFGTSILNSILIFFQATIAIIGMVYILKDINWIIIVLLVFISIIDMLMSHVFNKSQLKIFQSSNEDSRKRLYLSNLFLNRNAIGEIRIFHASNYFLEMWRKLYWSVQTPIINISNKKEFLFNSLMIVNHLIQLLILVVFVKYSFDSLTIGSFMLLIQAISQFQGRASEIVNSITHINQALLYLPNYFNFTELPEEQKPDKGKVFTGLKKHIKVNNLSFKYNNSDGLILKNLNFEIKKGEKVAIVGYNGSGKTTLIKCLLGIYSDYKGSICYDDLPIHTYKKESFRRHISVLFQQFGKYPLSLKDNIILGDLSKENVDIKLKNSLDFSGACTIPNQLPKGLETNLYPEFGDGVDLSGGQWQKVALSRMYFRDASIICLDEPTSALDPISEDEIYRKFLDFSENKTSIILTHRLGVCRWVDKIIVMDSGEIIEIGSHEGLLGINGTYKRMYETQSEWYKIEEDVSEINLTSIK